MLQTPSFIRQLSHTNLNAHKTIGLFAGVALLVNNITGPGVPQLANMFSEAGWLLPVFTFISIWIMTAMSTGMFAEAMRCIPGNESFQDRIEFTSVVRYYFGHNLIASFPTPTQSSVRNSSGRKAYLLSQICLNGALQALNIISVIQSAQVLDQTIADLFGKSCGLNLTPFALSSNANNTLPLSSLLPASTAFWSCIDVNDLSGGNPWGCHIVVTAGFVLCAAFAFPMGRLDLDSNMIVQIIAFGLTMLCWGVWLVGYAFTDERSGFDGWSLPAVNTDPSTGSQAGVLGTILFNFGFVTTVPSWINEKKANTSVNKTVYIATFVCILIFFVMGIPGAMAFRTRLAGVATNACSASVDGDCAGSVMDVLSSDIWLPTPLQNSPAAKFIMKFSVNLFPIVAVLSSIPVFSIVIKYNCLENGMKPTFSFLWGVIFPWVVSLPLINQPNALNNFISYSSLVFVSMTDFVVPFCLYVVLQRNKREAKRSQLLPRGSAEGLASDTPPHPDEVDRDSAAPFHHAIPEACGCSPRRKSVIASTLVVIMIVASVVATVFSVLQSSSNDWSCAAVGS